MCDPVRKSGTLMRESQDADHPEPWQLTLIGGLLGGNGTTDCSGGGVARRNRATASGRRLRYDSR